MKTLMFAAALMVGGAAMAQDTQSSGMGGMTVAPGNESPERDARGIPVVSAPATAPDGWNQPAQTVPAGTPPRTVSTTTTQAAGDMPPCSRTVTDHCTQTYERGRAPRG